MKRREFLNLSTRRNPIADWIPERPPIQLKPLVNKEA
jgi:hypothetical protein